MKSFIIFFFKKTCVQVKGYACAKQKCSSINKIMLTENSMAKTSNILKIGKIKFLHKNNDVSRSGIRILFYIF